VNLYAPLLSSLRGALSASPRGGTNFTVLTATLMYAEASEKAFVAHEAEAKHALRRAAESLRRVDDTHASPECRSHLESARREMSIVFFELQHAAAEGPTIR
jgi:hypothetical protein